MRLDELGEWGLIDRLRRYAAPEGGGFSDDCAVIAGPGGGSMLVTTDALVAGVHFDVAFMSWHDIGYRTLAASLSDLASSGATGPARYVVTLGAPGHLRVEEIEMIYAGMAELGAVTGAGLIGGDTVRSAATFLSLTAFAPTARPILRGGARVGDQVYVSGTLGESAAGLRRLLRGEPPQRALRFLRPLPRMELGAALGRLGVNACDDVSDGLYPEVAAIAKASAVGVLIDEDALPLASGVPREEALRYAYEGGEDFELVFTAGAGFDLAAAREIGVPISRIGEVLEAREGLLVRRAGGTEPLVAKGYQHFTGGEA